MKLRQSHRRLLAGLGWVLLAATALWVSLPLWFPWLLGPLARGQGIRYARYERLGYGRFALHELTLTTGSVRLRAASVEAVVPSAWLWRLWAGSGRNAAPFLAVSNWQLEAVPTPGRKPGSTYAAAVGASATLRSLRRWLPAAVFTNGVIDVAPVRLAIPAATWSRGKIEGRAAALAVESAPGLVPGGDFFLTGDFGTERSYSLRVASDTLRLESEVRLALGAQELVLQATNSWSSNRFVLHARFAREGGWPAEAELPPVGFRFPAGALGWPGYGDIAGSLAAHWEHGQFKVQLHADAEPVAGQTNLPPLALDLRAHGDPQSAVIESASLRSPGLTARLVREARCFFAGPPLRETATLSLQADLSRQPWLPLQGQLSGEAELRPAGTAWIPAARLRLAGSDIGGTNLQAKSVSVEATVDWPRCRLVSAQAAFEDGSTASLSGAFETRKRELADGRFAFQGPLVRRWLPAPFSFETLSMTGSVAGPLTNLAHRGNFELKGFARPGLEPLQMTANWVGRQAEVPEFNAVVSSGSATLDARGALQVGAAAAECQLQALTLRSNDVALLNLERPGRISFSASPARDGEAARSPRLRVTCTPLAWSGTGGSLRLEGAATGAGEGMVRVSVRELPSSLLACFLEDIPGDVELHTLEAQAAWTNGPASFELLLSGTARPGALPGSATDRPSPPLTLALALAGGPAGLVLSNLEVTAQGTNVLRGYGFLPLTLVPGDPTNALRLEEAQALNLTLKVGSRAFLWNLLTERTGILLSRPSLAAELSGTWRAPQGSLRLRAARFELEHASASLPRVEDIDLDLRLEPRLARLAAGRVRIQGQLAKLTGELPLKTVRPARLTEWDWIDWAQAQAHLRVEQAELGPLAELFPTLLAPAGEFSADVVLEPGGNLEGGLALTGARTRAVPNLGPVRDVAAKVEFHGRTLELREATAQVGGGAVTVTGQADLTGTNWLYGTLPPFRLVLRGTNVPLAREPQAILRADLDLAVLKTNPPAGAVPGADAPFITGQLRLRDSFYLSDLGALVPGKGQAAAPTARPPYFSVDDPILSDWRLAVRVTGDHFLKIRSTVFNGEVSANLNLGGTLKEPLALGELRADSGTVRFPFASLEVQQGLVSLASQDPHRPQLALNATSKQFGYDIKMEMTGPADEPILQFSSSPPLSSEQILLMVTAGELPLSEGALSSNQRAEAMAVFLGRDLLAKLGFSDRAEQRLTIHSGEDLSLSGKPTYSIEYKLDSRWSIIGEYDRFNDYNMGFKWRLYSK